MPRLVASLPGSKTNCTFYRSYGNHVRQLRHNKQTSGGPNAAPEWQAKSLWWRSREIMVACPLEGLVRSVAFPQVTCADLSCTTNIHATSATCSTISPAFTDALNWRPKAEIAIKIVSRLRLRSPEGALFRLSRDSPVSHAISTVPLARAISPNVFAMNSYLPQWQVHAHLSEVFADPLRLLDTSDEGDRSTVWR